MLKFIASLKPQVNLRSIGKLFAIELRKSLLGHRSILRRCQRKSRCKWPALEDDLYDWIMEMRAAGQCVSGNILE
jgi:hypothetical protein